MTPSQGEAVTAFEFTDSADDKIRVRRTPGGMIRVMQGDSEVTMTSDGVLLLAAMCRELRWEMDS